MTTDRVVYPRIDDKMSRFCVQPPSSPGARWPTRLTEASLHCYSYLSTLSGSSLATLRAGK